MLKQYTLRMPGAVFGGEDSLDKLTNLVEDSAKVAVFTDKGIEATGLAALVTAKIEQAGKEYVVFDELPAEPSYQQAQAVIDAFKASGADFIVAVGGGSVMDIAKLASLLKTNEYGVKELLDAPLRAHKCVPTLMIPTTAGTGAEATPNAIVAVPEKEVKIGIVNPEMIADYVILDPIMIKKLPRKIAASTGVDALCHAIECWTSNKANAFSDMYAMWALDLILNNIEKACDDPEAVQAKINMQTASFYAGVAITASGTTAVHALSYPMGGKYHVAHGESNYAMFTGVLKNYMELRRDGEIAVLNQYLADLLGCMPDVVYDELEKLLDQILPKRPLREYGVTREDLPVFAHSVVTEQGRLMANNFVPLDEARVLKIYQELF